MKITKNMIHILYEYISNYAMKKIKRDTIYSYIYLYEAMVRVRIFR